MKMAYLLVLAFGLSSVAQADTKVVGGGVKNRATGEVLVLTCETDAKTDEKAKPCKGNYQFAVGYLGQDGILENGSTIGYQRSYNNIRGQIDSDAVAQNIAPYDEVSIYSLTEAVFDGGAAEVGAVWKLWALYVDATDNWSVAGAIWRGVVLTALTPVVVGINTSVIVGSLAIDGTRIAGEAAYVGPHNLVQKIRRGFIRRRTNRAVGQLIDPSDRSVIKVSDRIFKQLVSAASGY